MIDLIYYKKVYFSDNIFVSTNEILEDFRTIGIKNRRKINENFTGEYNELKSTDLLKLLSDKIFFYQNENVKNNSIKNMLYSNNLIYQDFYKVNNIESYLYRLINENINRTLIFIGEFSNKNCPSRISKIQKDELINNIDNDVIYLNNNIILIKYKVYLPWLWKCRKNTFENLNNLDNISIYHLKNKWDFSNLLI